MNKIRTGMILVALIATLSPAAPKIQRPDRHGVGVDEGGVPRRSRRSHHVPSR